MGQVISTDNTETRDFSIPNQGTLTGHVLKSSKTGNKCTVRFAKVPFAEPCAGANRWKLPKALPDDYDYTGDYKDLGLKCPQPAVPNKKFNYVKSPSDENILYTNIWTPYSDKYKPKNGWPVLIYIHGGWLQYGEPNTPFFNAIEAFDDEEFTQKYIVVTMGYRLNMFGFLSGKELLEEDPKSSNFGFWDQRLAMEWTAKYIKYFGGDSEKITLGGLSAGSYSTFFQLAYELYHPEAKQIIKQLCFFSNMVYSQPKTIEESQEQFDEIVEKLGVSKTASSAEKLAKLRSIEPGFIEEFIPTLEFHTFRAVSDGDFVAPTLIKDLDSGEYTKKLIAKGVRILCGEVDNECLKYSLLNTPHTKAELAIQVENYYPKVVTDELLKVYDADSVDESAPDFQEQLRKKFGAIIGEGQVYSSLRGYLNHLVDHGFPQEDIYRYRVGFRAAWLDKHIPRDYKVPHGCDFHLWFYCLREGYTEEEGKHAKKWLIPYLRFLNFEKEVPEWPTSDIKKLRYLNPEGEAEYIEDPDWDWGVKVVNAVYKAQL